jgi:hypothetical protein
MDAMRRELLSGLGLALAGMLAACSNDTPGLPSLSDSATPTRAVSFEAVAVALHDCLGDSGIETVYEENGEGRPVLISFPDSQWAFWVDAQGGGGETEQVSDAEVSAAWDTYYEQHGGPEIGQDGAWPPFLLFDHADRSDDWSRCVGQTGYDSAAASATPDDGALTAAYRQLSLEASNEWARCARDNGFPETKDAHLPETEYGDPVAFLPTSITEEQLRGLLEVCPHFDPEAEKRNDEIWAAGDGASDRVPDGIKAQPNVGFDYPGYNGEVNEVVPERSVTMEDIELQRHLAALKAILDEAYVDYHSES